MTVRDVIDEFGIVLHKWSTTRFGEVQRGDVVELLRQLETLTNDTFELEMHQRRLEQLNQARVELLGPLRSRL